MVKLFIASHKEVYVPSVPLLTLINPDDASGVNIADKVGYSELRAHYHVWKNEPSDTDRVGFFQFRRYLNISQKPFTDYGIEKRPIPYVTQKLPLVKNYSETAFEALQVFDVIAPIREYTGISIWQRYGTAEGHRASDLRLTYDIIAEKYPEYCSAADSYFNGTGEYYGNLYIMRRTVFDGYCEWLFDILGEFDKRAEDIPPRTQGYLSERLFGVWFTNALAKKHLSCAEVPRIHFWGYDDENHNLHRDHLINVFLPPGSKRRVWVKKLMK